MLGAISPSVKLYKAETDLDVTCPVLNLFNLALDGFLQYLEYRRGKLA